MNVLICNINEFESTDDMSQPRKILNLFKQKNKIQLRSQCPEVTFDLNKEYHLPLTNKKGGDNNINIFKQYVAKLTFPVEPIKNKYKNKCLTIKKNIHIYFFYIDTDISHSVYIGDGGYLSALTKEKTVTCNDLIQEENIEDSELLQMDIIVPIFRLPDPTFVFSNEHAVSIERMKKITLALFVLLHEDNEQIIPTGSSLYQFEDNELSNVSKEEESAALALILASICKDNGLVHKIITDYQRMITICDVTDSSFLPRMIESNACYSDCKSVKELQAKIAEKMKQIVAVYATKHRDYPLAIKRFMSFCLACRQTQAENQDQD
jgi:hypothetical protein